MMDDCLHLIRLTYSQNLLKAVNPRSLAPIYVHTNLTLSGSAQWWYRCCCVFSQKEARHWARLLSILSFHNASVSLLADPWLTHFVLPNNSFTTSENVAVMFKSTKIIAAVMDMRLQSTLVGDQEGG